MNSLKKGEGVPLLNFEGVSRSQVPGSWSHFYTMPYFISYLRDYDCFDYDWLFCITSKLLTQPNFKFWTDLLKLLVTVLSLGELNL